MDIVELLLKESEITPAQYWEAQASMWHENYKEAADEIERLREDKAELVEALIDMRNHINERDWDEDVSDEAKATFAKTTGGE
jgi:hypothetical protein